MLQLELSSWRHKFLAEQRNFLMYLGVRRVAPLLLLVVALLGVAGSWANVAMAIGLLLYTVHKLDRSSSLVVYALLVIGIGAAIAEYFKYPALVAFNCVAFVTYTLTFFGLVDG